MAYTTAELDEPLPRVHHFSDLDRDGLTMCGIDMPEGQLRLRSLAGQPDICPDCERKFKQRKREEVNP